LIGTVALALTVWIGEGEGTACETDQNQLQKVVFLYHDQKDMWPTDTGDRPGDLFYDDPVGGPLVPDWVIEVPDSDKQCDWHIDGQGVVVLGDDATDCPCD
jgi:hypothetical protein